MPAAPTTTDREIAEQPEAIARTLDANAAELDALGKQLRRRSISTVVIAARGSSDNAGTYAKYLFPAFNRTLVAMATPSLYTFYHAPPRLKDVFVLGISQSGQSEDIVEVMAEARRQGALCACLTREERSPLAREAGCVLRLETGPEAAVAATKTFTSSLALLAALSVAWEGSAERAEALRRLPGQAAATLASAGRAAAETAPGFRDASRCVVVSRGFSQGIAMEIALKLKELTYVTAEPYSSADFQHGPLAMVEEGFPVVLVAGNGVLLDSMAEFAHELVLRKARLVGISDSNRILGLCSCALAYAEGSPEWLSPVLAVIPGQLFALRLSQAKGIDPDVPRGLNKVTVTR